MHWDMEGVSGPFTREHVWFWAEGMQEPIAEEGRRLLMTDMDSAAAAAGRSGVSRIDDCTVQGRVERHCEVVKWALGTGLDMPEGERA